MTWTGEGAGGNMVKCNACCHQEQHDDCQLRSLKGQVKIQSSWPNQYAYLTQSNPNEMLWFSRRHFQTHFKEQNLLYTNFTFTEICSYGWNCQQVSIGSHNGSGHRWIPLKRPVTRSFDVFFDLRLNKRLSKQSWGWWFETPSRLLCLHCEEFFFLWIPGVYQISLVWVVNVPGRIALPAPTSVWQTTESHWGSAACFIKYAL